MNFISTFDELNKLYEAAGGKQVKKLTERHSEEVPDGVYGDRYPQIRGNSTIARPYQKPSGYRGSDDDFEASVRNSASYNNHRNAWESLEEDAEIELVDDDAEIEIVDDEASAETEEAEFDQVILECDKCGALSIIDKDDMKVDEETDLVNVTKKCKSCEEKVGYKVIGCVAPYVTENAPADEEVDEEGTEEGADEVTDDEVQVAEDDTVVNEELAESDEELEELLDVKPSVTLNLDGGTGNDVSVLGR